MAAKAQESRLLTLKFKNIDGGGSMRKLSKGELGTL